MIGSEGQQQNLNSQKAYIRNRSAAYPAATVSAPIMAPSGNTQTSYQEAAELQQPFVFQPAPIDKFPISQPENVNKGLGCSPFAITNAFFKGLWGFIKLIKNTLLTALMILILAFLGLVLILIYRPPLFWNPIKTFLNNNVTQPVAINNPEKALEDLYKKINLTALSDQPVLVNDSELTLLMQHNTFLADKCFVKTSKNAMHFYIDIDNNERPLWFVTKTIINKENRIEIAEAGFGRFNTPQAVAAIVNDTLGLVFQFIENQVTADSVSTAFNEIIDTERLNENIELNQVEFNDGFVILFFKNNSTLETDFSY